MTKKVLMTDDLAPEAAAVFDKYPGIVVVQTATLSPPQLASVIADCDAVIVRSPTRLTPDILEAARRLRFVGRAGVGVDNVCLATATRLGITVMNAPRGNTISTAEHAIALLLSLVRRIPQAHASVARGEWRRSDFEGMELHGKTAGVVGLGRVGGEVARRLLAFGMRVIACDPFVDPSSARPLGVALLKLEALLPMSHVVTVHVPLGNTTTALIGAEQLAAMKDGAYLVNCARGGVVDEDALVEALDSERLAGVALDVYAEEPPGEHPIFHHPRSVFTPHLGAATREAQIRVATDVAESIAEALTSGVVRDAVNRPESPRNAN